MRMLRSLIILNLGKRFSEQPRVHSMVTFRAPILIA